MWKFGDHFGFSGWWGLTSQLRLELWKRVSQGKSRGKGNPGRGCRLCKGFKLEFIGEFLVNVKGNEGTR